MQRSVAAREGFWQLERNGDAAFNFDTKLKQLVSVVGALKRFDNAEAFGINRLERKPLLLQTKSSGDKSSGGSKAETAWKATSYQNASNATVEARGETQPQRQFPLKR